MDRIRRLGLTGVDERCCQLVVDDDGVECKTDGLRVVGGDDGDRFALVSHDIGCQHRLVGVLQSVVGVAGHVGGGEYGVDACDGDRRSDVDRPYACRRVG